MTSSVEVRGQIVDMVRRDLIGPLPEDIEPADADLQRERLREQPSWWYLTGYIAPIEDLGDERLRERCRDPGRDRDRGRRSDRG